MRTIRSAFTLIELLIVIAIIALLVGISVVVGTKVVGSGKQKATEQVLRSLDAALTAYIAEKGSNPPAFVADPRGNDAAAPASLKANLIPIVDGINMTGGTPGTTINSVGLFMLQAKASAGASAALSQIASTSKFYKETSPDGTNTDEKLQPTLPTILDGWGNPIRFVHPAFKGVITDKTYAGSNPAAGVDVEKVIGKAAGGKKYGIATIRRGAQSAAATGGLLQDADCGVPKGDRPYFYSAGADSDPSTTDDNVYVTQPTFPAKK